MINRSKVTTFHVWSYLWIFALNILVLGLHVGTGYVIIDGYQSLGGATWYLIAVAVVCTVLCLSVHHLVLIVVEKLAAKYQKEHPQAWREAHDKVQAAIDEIGTKRKLRPFKIAVIDGVEHKGSKLSSFAGMLDSLYTADLIIVGEKLTRVLSQPELTAVVAHELRHSDRIENKLKIVSVFMRSAIGLIFFAGALMLLWQGIWNWSLMPAKFQLLCTGVGFMFFTGMAAKVLQAKISRWTEAKTDVLASMDVNCGEVLGHALDKLSTALREEYKVTPTTPWYLATHPKVEARKRLMAGFKHLLQSLKTAPAY